MRKITVALMPSLLLFATIAHAQGANTLSPTGDVGINTTAPATTLDVNGNSSFRAPSIYYSGTTLSGYIGNGNGLFYDATSSDLGIRANGNLYFTANNSGEQMMTIDTSGYVGIGTIGAPSAIFDVAGTQTNQGGGDYLLNYGLGWGPGDPDPGDVILLVPAAASTPVNGSQFAGTIQSNRGSSGAWNLNSQWYVSVQSAFTNNTGSISSLSGQQEYGTIPTLITCVYNGTTYIGFQTPANNSQSLWSLTGNWSNGQSSQKPILVAHTAVTNISPLVNYESLGSQISVTGLGTTGDVGIGTTAPGAKLEVAGNVKLTAGSGASMTFQDGTVQSTAWNGTLTGGDYAESIDVLGDRAAYEPGDVIVIDDNETGKFNKSDKPYSKLVAGVYSTKPGLVGRRTTADRPDKEAEVPMAMMGIVPTKVTTENGPIERGDLLVSSSKPGYAMKGTDRDRLTGAVIGKALASMKSGTGVIEVLISLQ